MTRRRSALPVVVVLFFLVFSPTINQALIDAPVARAATQLFAGLIAAVFLARYRPTRYGNRFIGAMAITAFAVLVLDPFVTQDVITVRKLVGLLTVVMLAPAVADDHPVALKRFLIFTLAVNLVMVGFQLAGNSDLAYRFVTYENEGATPVDLVALSDYLRTPIPVGYLPQLRPSGAFPSPTYLSLTLILLWYAIASAPANRSRLAAMLFGVLAILSGSSVGLFLVLISAAFLPLKGRLIYTVLGAGVTLWAYATFAPYQFNYNFNVSEFLAGFTSRLDLDAGGESIVQQRPYEFAIGIVIALVAVLFARRLHLLTLARAGLVIVFPVMLHDVGSSLLYWMLVAFAVQSHTAVRLVAPAPPRRVTSETTIAAPAVPG